MYSFRKFEFQIHIPIVDSSLLPTSPSSPYQYSALKFRRMLSEYFISLAISDSAFNSPSSHFPYSLPFIYLVISFIFTPLSDFPFYMPSVLSVFCGVSHRKSIYLRCWHIFGRTQRRLSPAAYSKWMMQSSPAWNIWPGGDCCTSFSACPINIALLEHLHTNKNILHFFFPQRTAFYYPENFRTLILLIPSSISMWVVHKTLTQIS